MAVSMSSMDKNLLDSELSSGRTGDLPQSESLRAHDRNFPALCTVISPVCLYRQLVPVSAGHKTTPGSLGSGQSVLVACGGAAG
jgi:hypothetical protein